MREPGRTWPAWGNGTCPGSSSGGGWHPAISPLPPTASPELGAESYLRTASAAYEEVAAILETLAEALPEEGSGEVSEADGARIAKLVTHRDTWRRARAAERSALAVLSKMLSRPPLPPVVVDPLHHQDQGRRLASWRADLSVGVYDVTLSGDTIKRKWIYGREPEGEVSDVLAEFPHAAEWRIAVETVEGGGLYQVKEQPSAENDWTTVLRIDDGMTWQNSTELMIWAIPMK
jgi:hypothetical protein